MQLYFLYLNCSGFGAIIRNAAGEVMAGMSVKGPYVNNSEEAEVLACQKAIEFSIKAGFSELMIEGDNANVIRAISSPLANKSLLGHVYEDIRSYFGGLHSASISWVRRGGNMIAHLLAQYARNISDEMYWLEDSPPPAVAALDQDSLHLNE